MRKALASQFISLFLFLLPGAQTTTHKSRYELVGPVKTLETGSVEYKSGVEGNRMPNQKITFNEWGDVTELVGYSRENGTVSHRHVYTYDDQGRNTGYEEYSGILDKTLTVPRHHVYTLDEKGRRREYEVYESDGTLGSRFVDVYDEAGNKTEEQFFSHTGALGGKTVHVYDGKGNEVKTINYDGDEKITWRNESRYDDDGRRTEWVQYHGDTLRYKVFYEYDGKGRVVEAETLEFNAPPNFWTSHAPVPGKVVTKFDDGKRTKEVASYDVDGSLKERSVYSFDGMGNQVGLSQYKADGAPKETVINSYDKGKLVGTLSGSALLEYEFDSHGNWTKKIHKIRPEGSKKSVAWSAEYRVITYY